MLNVKSYYRDWKAIAFALLCWLVAIILIVNAGFEREFYERWLSQKYQYPTQDVIAFCILALVEIIIFYLILYHLKRISIEIRLALVFFISIFIAFFSLFTYDMPPVYYAHGLWLGLVGITAFITMIIIFLKKSLQKANRS